MADAPHATHPQAALVLAIDPGRSKCGLAVVERRGVETVVLERSIVDRSGLTAAVRELALRHSATQLVMGDSTTSDAAREELTKDLPSLPPAMVDESNSTMEARALYWKEHPPQSWRRLIPLSLQAPPVPIDDFAAVVLARRFLNKT